MHFPGKTCFLLFAVNIGLNHFHICSDDVQSLERGNASKARPGKGQKYSLTPKLTGCFIPATNILQFLRFFIPSPTITVILTGKMTRSLGFLRAFHLRGQGVPWITMEYQPFLQKDLQTRRQPGSAMVPASKASEDFMARGEICKGSSCGSGSCSTTGSVRGRTPFPRWMAI